MTVGGMGLPEPDEKRVLQTFLELARIPSPSGHEAGVAAYARSAFEHAGCEVVIDDTAAVTGSDTGNLIATLPGTVPGTIFITAHMDTMTPADEIRPQVGEDGIIRSDGTSVLGGDDKVGIAAAIEVVRVLASASLPRPEVRVLLTVQEEVGLVGARALADDLFDGALTLVCDEPGEPGTVVVTAPFHHTFSATFRGVASHAAAAPEMGISAIRMAADAVASMQLGRVGADAVANVGTIGGGTADNTVPPECTITGECRAFTAESACAVRDAMTACMERAAADAGGKVDIEWTFQYPGFLIPAEAASSRLAERAADACDLPFMRVESLGATDANVFTLKGASCLLVATGMKDFHTTHESLAVRDLVDTARFLLAVICMFGDDAGRGAEELAGAEDTA
jgi:tripeptide aminopeptidase